MTTNQGPWRPALIPSEGSDLITCFPESNISCRFYHLNIATPGIKLPVHELVEDMPYPNYGNYSFALPAFRLTMSGIKLSVFFQILLLSLNIMSSILLGVSVYFNCYIKSYCTIYLSILLLKGIWVAASCKILGTRLIGIFPNMLSQCTCT